MSNVYKKRGDYIDSTAIMYMAEYDNVFTQDFIHEIESLLVNGVYGVYYFSTIDNKPLYIGQSINLGGRIISSYAERFCLPRTNFWDRKSRAWMNHIYVQYLVPEKKSDLLIIESYLIAKLKPKHNRVGIFEDEPSIKIPIPEMTPKIRVIERFTDEYIKDALKKSKNNKYELHIYAMESQNKFCP